MSNVRQVLRKQQEHQSIEPDSISYFDYTAIIRLHYDYQIYDCNADLPPDTSYALLLSLRQRLETE